ncbi:MAG: hypothetical protein KJ630_22075 [Proteobacteria bacterium]|nr:hypothetical protein [Pseudomonadota bacterium]
METYCFIGSDKNAGKTTAFNFIYDDLCRQIYPPVLCVTGIGINGESIDNFDGSAKPPIRLWSGSYFLTHIRHLQDHSGKYQTLQNFGEPHFHGQYVFGQCLADFATLLEGPNSRQELLLAKAVIVKVIDDGILLLDGSIDRQFLADPAISDMFYFAILFSGSKVQQQRAAAMLYALQLPPGPAEVCDLVRRLKSSTTKSLLLSPDGQVHYHSTEMPFSDRGLRMACEALGKKPVWLYLGGALTRSLADFLGPLANIALLLDNFTHYQCQSGDGCARAPFRSPLALLQPVRLKAIFIREEAPFDPGILPVAVPVINLFRREELGFRS